ncbi:hypothetical protein LX36DRAFT_332552 [Colletotrichum falcatum]|nr:hypothetical protein LX36DRAFT_332552 [Colletotrichum falcatum]
MDRHLIRGPSKVCRLVKRCPRGPDQGARFSLDQTHRTTQLFVRRGVRGKDRCGNENKKRCILRKYVESSNSPLTRMGPAGSDRECLDGPATPPCHAAFIPAAVDATILRLRCTEDLLVAATDGPGGAGRTETKKRKSAVAGSVLEIRIESYLGWGEYDGGLGGGAARLGSSRLDGTPARPCWTAVG